MVWSAKELDDTRRQVVDALENLGYEHENIEAEGFAWAVGARIGKMGLGIGPMPGQKMLQVGLELEVDEETREMIENLPSDRRQGLYTRLKILFLNNAIEYRLTGIEEGNLKTVGWKTYIAVADLSHQLLLDRLIKIKDAYYMTLVAIEAATTDERPAGAPKPMRRRTFESEMTEEIFDPTTGNAVLPPQGVQLSEATLARLDARRAEDTREEFIVRLLDETED